MSIKKLNQKDLESIDWHKETLDLLRDAVNNNHTVSSIAESTGLNYHWLSKFYQDRCKNPGVNTVMKLNRYLKNI